MNATTLTGLLMVVVASAIVVLLCVHFYRETRLFWSRWFVVLGVVGILLYLVGGVMAVGGITISS